MSSLPLLLSSSSPSLLTDDDGDGDGGIAAAVVVSCGVDRRHLTLFERCHIYKELMWLFSC